MRCREGHISQRASAIQNPVVRWSRGSLGEKLAVLFVPALPLLLFKAGQTPVLFQYLSVSGASVSLYVPTL